MSRTSSKPVRHHRPVRPRADIDGAVARRRTDAEQWRTSYLLGASLNR